MREMVVLGVRVSVPGNEVVVVLGEPGGDLVLPIVIGPREGAAIASAQAGLVPPRPLTHDLLVSILDRLGVKVVEVRVTHVLHGIFHAELVLGGGAVVDARPSDAIAIALRAHCPVLCEESLLALAGVPVEDAGLDASEVSEAGAASGTPPARAEESPEVLEEFRVFLEGVEPEDFEDPGGNEPPAGGEAGGPEGPGGEKGPRHRADKSGPGEEEPGEPGSSRGPDQGPQRH
ncbi:bifunctional nuclease family protein [Georgenia yuyongxinii]|uniref:Bifunctional nuclease family protein n=1 Tax=Georgenia yuyongxinii TaxID=2589797 RepID=A0A5B8C1R4_9MICO|nr:bifunctional nuclease family protein [Georgenia yuyongxinii]QDC24619.1 bifunctional nuclease family protein [Georgenia yuyongxinii]